MSVFVVANKFSSAKTLTSYYLAKYQFSLGKKVLLINFDDTCIFKRLFKTWKKFYLSYSQNKSNIIANIMKGSSFDLINIFSNIEYHNFSQSEIYEKIANIVKILNDVYEIIIVDTTSTSSLVNDYFINNDFNILVPILLDDSNQIEYYSSFLQTPNINKHNINYFVVSFDKNNNNHIFNLIKLRKYLTNFLLNNFVSFFSSSDETLIFNKKEVENEYKNVFKELKIV
ncbi:MAG: hypothetical protein RSA40_02430 [Malacoplasma sp.]